MIWVNVAYLVGCIYGLFTGTVLSVRIGKRDTLVIGLLVFCVRNVLCGAATGLLSLAFGRLVEGFGKLRTTIVDTQVLHGKRLRRPRTAFDPLEAIHARPGI